ncbi:MAG: tyrosine--tRNA ligase [Candidatus Micrarchaeota archaeon]
MDLQSKIELASKPPVAEVVTPEDLRQLFEANPKPKHYIGFEVSGLLHVGSLFVSGNVINNLSKAGVETTVFLADWHSLINNKLGGDWEKLQAEAEYFEEAFNFFCPKVKIVRGTDLYHDNDEYWKSVLKFSMHVTIARATRTMQVLGREENEILDVAKYIYPSMQAVDIKFLNADIAHAGMDQRKVHMLAREVFPKMGWKPPIALHHRLLPSLLGEELKMSKSKPESAVFIHDPQEEIKKKVSKAFCPEKQAEGNPVLAYARDLVFQNKKTFSIDRLEKFGGRLEFDSFPELEGAFARGELHPADLKNGIAGELDEIIEPVRTHFEKGKAKELFEKVRSFQVTR